MTRPRRALSSFPFAKDILVNSRDEVEYRCTSMNNVVSKALRGGTVLYEETLSMPGQPLKWLIRTSRP